jgi:predicted RNA-binding Zn-ribbon protein involved in translation (DUF1610 family)
MPNHKSEAVCPNCNQEFVLGAHQSEVKKLFGTKICGSKGYEIEGDKLLCVGCNTLIANVKCPNCGFSVPATEFFPKKLRDIFK